MATINTNTGQSFDDQQIKDWFGTGKSDNEVAQRSAELNLNQGQITNALSVGRSGTQDPNKVNSYVADTSNGYAWDTNGGLINAPSTGTGTGTGTNPALNTSFSSPSYAPSSNWNVQADQTVEGRINRLIDPNNPLIAQARANSAQQMNQRGLLNSSIASTAADSAAYQAAMPIAQSDAATYARAAEINTNQENQFKTQSNQQGYDLAKMDKTNAQQVAQLQQKFGYDKDLLNLQSASAREQANITAQYRNLTQFSASASSMINNASDHIHSIMMNADLDSSAKQVAIDAYYSNLNRSLQLIGSASGDLDLSNMLETILA
jgi:hypothetical protein